MSALSVNQTNFQQTGKEGFYIVDANKSVIAEKIGVKSKGEYAIKVR